MSYESAQKKYDDWSDEEEGDRSMEEDEEYDNEPYVSQDGDDY